MALPPRYQNMKDLKVMIDFLEKHPVVMAELKLIDMESFIIHYGVDGEVRFGREVIKRKQGWVGPAAPLEFKRANREID